MLRLLVILNVFSFVLNGQNLVSNYSFECDANRCDPTLFASDFYQNACNWSCPQRGTTDVFSTQIANKTCFCSMPYDGSDTSEETAHVGSQAPRTGNRFAGIYTYSLEPAKDTSYREYLQTKLIEPLVPGQNYCAKMYVSRAGHLKYATNNLGMYFGSAELNIGSYVGPLDLRPQIIEKGIISESEGWLPVSGTFKVNDTAQYLIIGNFFYNYQTDVTVKEGPVKLNKNYLYAYYFIDDISVTKLDIPHLAYSGATTICEGSTARVKALGEWDNVTWTTLSDTNEIISTSVYLYVKPVITTSYVVTATICQFIVRDTISVTVRPKPALDLGHDTTICRGSVFHLDAGPNRFKVTWQDESNERFLLVQTAGLYAASVQNEFGCESRDEISISVLDKPVINIGNDTTVCAFYPLEAGKEAIDAVWSDGSTDSIMLPSQHGRYWVTAKNRCGEVTDTINIYSYSDIFIPNVITPNHDGFNDTFQIRGLTQNIFPVFQAYNRWGVNVFANHRYNGNWPDAAGNTEPGSYFYILMFQGCETFKGWLKVEK